MRAHSDGEEARRVKDVGLCLSGLQRGEKLRFRRSVRVGKHEEKEGGGSKTSHAA
jgi:hypothetical protein